MDRTAANAARYRSSLSQHYESWFLRGNDPSRERAFWIRYTNLVSEGATAIGERWAIVFEGAKITAAYDRVPITSCHFDAKELHVRIGDSELRPGHARGGARGKPGEGVSDGPHHIRWELDYDSRDEEPLLLLAERRYASGFPAAKALVPDPSIVFRGALHIDGRTIDVSGWTGSQNHNWGSRHTDRYAWGQVAGFEHHPTSFLEVSSAQLDLLQVGDRALRSPWFTPIVLRHAGKEYALNAMHQAALNDGHYDDRDRLRWTFGGRGRDFAIRGRMETEHYVALPYGNTRGGTKECLNSKLASCIVDLSTRTEHVRLTSGNAAFEILREAQT